MFIIRCETCAAKLKVTQPSAIDQKLACPKCGNMILVAPPADWQPPADWAEKLEQLRAEHAGQSQSQTNLSRSTSSSQSELSSFADFDDIEHLLNQPTHPSKSTAHPQPNPSKSQLPTREAQTGNKKSESPTASGKPTGAQPKGTKPSGTKPASVQPPGVQATSKTPSSPGSLPSIDTKTKSDASTGAVLGKQVASPVAVTTQAAEVGPLPNNVSDSVRRRQRVLLAVFGTLAGVLGIIVAIVIYSSAFGPADIAKGGNSSEENKSKTSETSQGKSDGQPNAVAPNDGVDATGNHPNDNKTDASVTNPDQERNPPVKPAEVGGNANGDGAAGSSSTTGNAGANSDGGNATNQQMATPPANDNTTQTPPLVDNQPPTVDLTGDPPPTLPISPLKENNAGNQETPPKTPSSELANAMNPLGRPTQDLSVAPELFNNRSVNDALGELSTLLSQTSDTSLNELADVAASQRRVSAVGLSPIFIEKTESPRIVGTLPERLTIPIKEVQYIQSPLAVEVNQLAKLVGYPITFDLLHIDSQQLDLFQPMTWDAADVTLDQVLEKMLSDAGLRKDWVTPADAQTGLNPIGMVIRPIKFDQLATQTYDIPEMAQRTPEQRLELQSQVKSLVAPFSWDQANGPGTLTENGDQWEVSQLPVGHRAMTQWLRKLQAAAELAQQKNTAAAEQQLATISQLAEPKLSQRINWQPTWERGLDEVLEQLRREFGVRVLIDWDALATQGWNPWIKVPGIEQQKTVQEFLDQLTQAMELGWRMVDAQTVEITSLERLRVRMDLEVYSLADLARTGLTAERIRDLLNAVIGVQAGRAGAIWYYDAPTQSLCILAPQWLQRQVAPILDRLRNRPR